MAKQSMSTTWTGQQGPIRSTHITSHHSISFTAKRRRALGRAHTFHNGQAIPRSWSAEFPMWAWRSPPATSPPRDRLCTKFDTSYATVTTTMIRFRFRFDAIQLPLLRACLQASKIWLRGPSHGRGTQNHIPCESKTGRPTLDHNFAKCWPIFKILSRRTQEVNV